MSSLFQCGTIPTDDVKSSLFLKDLMDKELTNSHASDGKAEAFNVRRKNTEQNSGNKSQEKHKFCNYCKNKGHIIDDYWKFRNKEKCSYKCQSSKSKENFAETSYMEAEDLDHD